MCLLAQSHPSGSKAAFPHTQKTNRNTGAGELWEQLLHDWDHPLPLLSQLIYEASLYSPHQHPLCNFKLVFSTGQERSLCLVTLFSTQQDNPLPALSNHHTEKKHYLFYFWNTFDLSIAHYVKIKSLSLCLVCQSVPYRLWDWNSTK